MLPVLLLPQSFPSYPWPIPYVYPGVEGEALLHMEELGNYTLKYLAQRRTRKPPHDLVTGQTPDYMLSN